MKHKVTLLILAIFFLSISISVYIAQKQQDLRTRAATTSKLYFSPQSTLINPIEKKVGEEFSLDVMLDPGANDISLLKLQMSFNSTAFEGIGRNTFVVNNAAFPTIMEGPLVDNDNGVIYITFSVGADRLKTVDKPTKLGTITLKAKQAVSIIASTIVFDNKTQAFSIKPNDHAFENVIGSAIPAYIAILDGQPTPEPEIPQPTTSSEEPTPPAATTTTPGVQVTPTVLLPTYPPIPDHPTVTPQPSDTTLSFETLLHGIGSAGDNINSRDNTLSNKNPKNPKRNVTVEILTSTNNLITKKTGVAIYNPKTGSFTGTINLGEDFAPGNYIVKLKGERYLSQQISGVQVIRTSSTNELPKSSLTTGDINDDNLLNILDYNLLTSCFSEINTNTNCDSEKRRSTDLTDDDKVNHFDYNLFLREISSQNGK